ncbi:NfeD family protein [Microvirga terricola]|uniref:NfeD family protein n=1 Tax=Microvirga terricola TaxID=2719797 RepID=A0ABX0VET2_9HYPH|nr:NfeD family protein [Microvirga terricola]NIX77981.1 NfeD family protein [Microvirga terricola]
MIETILSFGPWAWIILGLVLAVLELIAPGVFLIWLGLAAIVTGLLDAFLNLSWQASALVFSVLSVATVLLGRQLTRTKAQPDTQASFLNRRGETLIGQVFTLETDIANGEGRIRVGDSSWRVTGTDHRAGTKVRVVRVEGTTLVVEAA